MSCCHCHCSCRSCCMPEFSIPFGGTSSFSSDVDTSTTTPTVITTGASPGMGSWAEMIAATPHHAAWISVVARGYALYDIGIGGSGSEVVIIPELAIRARSFGDSQGPFLFPIFIPAGSRISARANDGGSSSSVYAHAVLTAPSSVCPVGGGYVYGYGDTDISGYALSLDPGGTANTKSSWLELTAATNRPHNWFVLQVYPTDSTLAAAQNWFVDLAVGGSGSEQVVAENLFLSASTTSDQFTGGPFYLPISVPQGSRISVRAQCSVNTASDRLLRVRLFGV